MITSKISETLVTSNETVRQGLRKKYPETQLFQPKVATKMLKIFGTCSQLLTQICLDPSHLADLQPVGLLSAIWLALKKVLYKFGFNLS